MTNPPDREVTVFNAARGLPVGERAAYLDKACAGDAALRQRVEELLQSHEQAAGFMDEPAASGIRRTLVLSVPLAEKVGDRIGHYKLLQQIGEGGCGVVYMAEQEEPVRRRVALKVIKLGMDTKSVIARFEAERQALALMDHPNIAKVLDAGATETGRPFFVMELVRGIKITDYCDQNDLSTRERLDLFIQVCRAIQHAHQKGVIHRDIKPSNILVTMDDGEPLPKVIDFGIAKATEGKLTDQTVFTAFEQFIGTPAYMSPEQAEMSARDVDTRSDIYSLGVLLYKLLTGRTPFDAKKLLQAGLDEIRRTIRQDEPARPSTCLSTMADEDLTAIAKHRKVEAPKLIHLVRGDLDWIVMKTLEKDRARRYETANAFARDIERFLADEPVVARPPGKLYKFQKLVRRNKLVFIAGSAVIATLVVGFWMSTWEAVRAQREARRANAALDDLRASAPAFMALAWDLAARQRYDEAAEKMDYAIKLRPDAAEYLLAKADLFECQLRFAEAEPIYRAVLRLNPKDALAQTNATLCVRFQAEQATQTKLSWASILEFLAELKLQHRPDVEMALAGRLLRETDELLRTNWLGRLKDVPIPPPPLAQRLIIGEDGLLMLDLSGASLTNIDFLRDAPVSELWLDNTRVANLMPLAGLPLKRLVTRETPVQDLAFLNQARCRSTLEELWLWRTQVKDVSPLAGCGELKILDLADTEVTDLNPLRKLKLRTLYLTRAPVRDLAVVADMSLKTIFLDGVEITNITPLTHCQTLENILLPTRARNVEQLRSLPKLAMISYQRNNKDFLVPRLTADEFWATENCDHLISDTLELNDDGKLKEVAKKVHSELRLHIASGKPRLDADTGMTYLKLCATLAYLRDHETYRVACAEQLALGGATTDPSLAERAAKACLILPDSGVDVSTLSPLIRVSQGGAGNADFEPWSLLLTLLASYRAGDFPAAIAAGSRLANHPNALTETKAAGAAILAMAEQRSGHPDSAQAALKSARGLMVDHWQAKANSLNWWDWMMASVLIREAEQLIEGQTNAPPQ